MLSLWLLVPWSVSAYENKGLYLTSSQQYNSSRTYTSASAGMIAAAPVAKNISGGVGAASISVPSRTAYQGYHSEIYAPFSGESPIVKTPIRRAGAREEEEEDGGPSTGGNAGDPPTQSDLFPIGTEWVLLLMALAYIFFLRIKNIQRT